MSAKKQHLHPIVVSYAIHFRNSVLYHITTMEQRYFILCGYLMDRFWIHNSLSCTGIRVSPEKTAYFIVSNIHIQFIGLYIFEILNLYILCSTNLEPECFICLKSQALVAFVFLPGAITLAIGNDINTCFNGRTIVQFNRQYSIVI